MHKVLVTGGCGAIGSEVINRLKAKHPDTLFVNIDALTYAGKESNIEPTTPNYKFVFGNICDERHISYILEKEKPDVIIHLAAETHVDNSFGNSFQFTQTNMFGTHVLLECVRRYIEMGNSFKLFLHMSTDEVYGSVDEKEHARHEESLFSPSNPYSAAKAAAEMMCHAYQKSFKVPITIIRCNNAISKYQHPEKLIPNTVRCILEGKKVPVHGRGMSKRTFIHAYDIADAIDTIIDKGEVGSVYNIGTHHERTVIEVITTILKEISSEIGIDNTPIIEDWIDFVPDRPFQDYRYAIDTTALRSLGWIEKITFEEAVREVVKFHLRTKN
jgi:dTDP-glucose 4,6-dehydratase